MLNTLSAVVSVLSPLLSLPVRGWSNTTSTNPKREKTREARRWKKIRRKQGRH
ncbi:MAG: hypothetical protein WC869_01125 [Phycisphaerae bacterium]|jgi:hypothetical protein